MPQPPTARLHLPSPALGACVYLGVERDTRGVALTDVQRLNHYPATPLPTLSWIFEGDLHLLQEPGSPTRSVSPALARVVFSGPSRRPVASWSPGPVHALTVAFYPQALVDLLGVAPDLFLDRVVPLETLVERPMFERLAGIATADGRGPFERLEGTLLTLWQGAQESRQLPTLRAWVQSMAVRASFSRGGAGVRRAQRRFKDWTGQSHRELQLYVRAERALAGNSVSAPGAAPNIAGVATEAGYADQSHLGREVRRVTGLSPARLAAFMRTDESFWFYRLLAGHLESARRQDPGLTQKC